MARLLRALVVATLLAGAPDLPLPAQESSLPPGQHAAVPVSLSAHGLPGLVNVPVAADLPPGWAEMNFNTTPDYDLWQGRAESQYAVHFAFSLFERIVLSVRGTEVPSAVPLPPTVISRGPDFTITTERTALVRDLSPSLQVLALREGPSWPSLVLGGSDVIGGAAHFESKYVVASKTFRDRVRLTAGYGFGPDFLDGPLAGVELAPTRHVVLLGEYDAHQLNGALRLIALPEALVATGVPRPTVDVIWSEGEGVSLGITVRAPMDQDVVPRPDLGPPDPGEAEQASGDLASRLVGQGLENVRVVRHAGRLTVAYENRRFNQHELDGVARVLRAAAATTSEQVDSIRVVVRQADVPVLRLDVARADLAAFLEGRISGRVLEERTRVGFADDPPGTGAADAPVRNSSRLKLDVVLRPRLQTRIFTELGVWDGRIGILPNAILELGAGTRLDVGYLVPLDQTRDFLYLGGPLPDPGLERALVHHARRLHSDGPSALWAQWSAGRFDRDHVGVRQETALLLKGGVLALGTDVAWLGPDYDGLDQVMATGTARYYLPRWDTRVSLTGGRFLSRDWAGVAELSRFWGDTEIGLFLRHSERDSQVGARIALPLTGSRDLRPYRVRPRLPDRWEYAQQSTVFRDRNIIRHDIARTLSGDYGLENVYLDRDRLIPASVGVQLGHPRFWRR